MHHFSLWLLPPKPIQAVFQPVIDRWAKKLNTPSFEPHITILGEISGSQKQVIRQTDQLAVKTKPVPITFSEVSVSTTYFQCVFARVKPTLAILSLYQRFQKKFHYSTQTLYMPHMSLIYGRLGFNQRLAAVNAIKLPVKQFLADRIILVDADSRNPKTWRQTMEFFLNP